MSLLYNGKPCPGTNLTQASGGVNRACIGAWLFGEDYRVYRDSSKYAWTCRVSDNGAASPTNIALRAPGRLGGIAYKGLTTTRTALRTDNTFVPPSASWTVSFWVNPLDWHDYGPLMSQWREDSNERSWAIVLFGDGTLHAYASSNGTNFRQYGTTSTLPLRTWTQVTVVYPASGGTILIYFNGVLQSTTNSGTEAYSGTKTTLGTMQLFFGYAIVFAGITGLSQSMLFEAARIDNRILTADEILWLYRNQFGAWLPIQQKLRAEKSTTVDATVNLTGVSATASAGTLAANGSAGVTLTGAPATAAVGTFGHANDYSKALTGIAGTAAAGSCGPSVSVSHILSSVSATAAIGNLAPNYSGAVSLVGNQATAFAGDLRPTQVLITLPMITIMNDNPIPEYGLMADDDVPMEGILPYQIAFEGVINTNPVPMTGTLSAVPVPAEGSVP